MVSIFKCDKLCLQNLSQLLNNGRNEDHLAFPQKKIILLYFSSKHNRPPWVLFTPIASSAASYECSVIPCRLLSVCDGLLVCVVRRSFHFDPTTALPSHRLFFPDCFRGKVRASTFSMDKNGNGRLLCFRRPPATNFWNVKPVKFIDREQAHGRAFLSSRTIDSLSTIPSFFSNDTKQINVPYFLLLLHRVDITYAKLPFPAIHMIW
jgi:hypothetical protein